MKGTLTTNNQKYLKLIKPDGTSMVFPNLTFVASSCKSKYMILSKIQHMSSVSEFEITDEANVVIENIITANEFLF